MERNGVPVKRKISHKDINGEAEVWMTKESNHVKFEPKKVEFSKNTGKPQDNSSDLKEIGLIYGGSLILGTLIGPGIFTSPKGVIAGAGSVGLSLLIWAACGVFSTMAALCFTELRESVQREGVEYAYISEAFGPVAAFVYCWMRIAAAEPVGTAVFCVAFADYAADAIYDDCGPPQVLRKSLAILALITLALLNGFSNKLADQVQILSTVGKVTALGVIIVFGIIRLIQGHHTVLKEGFKNSTENQTSLAFAVYNGLWAYGGWSNVNHVTRGVKKPPRNLPRLVKTVIPLVSIIYMLVVTSYFTVMTKYDMLSSEAIGVTWGERMLGNFSSIIPIGVGLTALGSANGTFLTAGRLSGVAVKDGQMPEIASWIHVRSKTNIITLICRAVIATIMIIVGSIDSLVRFFIFTVWIFHGLSVLALLVLRVKNKEKKRPYKVNIVIPVIVVAVIACFTLAPFLEKPRTEFICSLALVALSLLLYIPSRYIKWDPKVTDRVTIFLQLFFRIAPRRSLRRMSLEARKASIAIARKLSIKLAQSALRRSASSATIFRKPSDATAFRKSRSLRRTQTCSGFTDLPPPSSPNEKEKKEIQSYRRDSESGSQIEIPMDDQFNIEVIVDKTVPTTPTSDIDDSDSEFMISPDQIHESDLDTSMFSLFSGTTDGSSTPSDDLNDDYSTDDYLDDNVSCSLDDDINLTFDDLPPITYEDWRMQVTRL